MSAALSLDPRTGSLLEIPDADGEVHCYRIAPAPEGLDAWACLLERAGQDGHGPYRVSVSPSGTWRCSCLDARYRGRGGGCKHRLAVEPFHALMRRLMPAGGSP